MFAKDCVELTNKLPDTKLASHICQQLIRCATSTAANYRATRLAQSKAAFIAKLSIVIEETDESEFWIDFATDQGLLLKEDTQHVIKEARELTAIFVSSRKTLQARNKK
jgi:four helix bundle protein